MSCTLLIAEDEKYLREKVTKNIAWADHGYVVFEAATGEEALEILAAEDIDILVTDIRMPGIDGIELTERAKAGSPKLKVVIISGHAEFELAQASIRLGVEDYLLKPFRSERLLEVVQRTRHKLESERRRTQVGLRQEEVAKRLLEHRFSNVFGWLADPKSLLSQSQVRTRQRLMDILRTGTSQDLAEEIGLLQGAMDEFWERPDNVFLMLNDIVVSALTIVKEQGFELEEAANLITRHLPAGPQSEIDDLKRWVEDFLLEINGLLKSRQKGRTEQLIATVVAYLNEHYRGKVALHSLAADLNMSPSQLSKLFLEHVGENFSDYVNRLKSQKAKELLKASDKRVYEIADYLGFSDAYYFSAWFKRVVGISPTQYREELSNKG